MVIRRATVASKREECHTYMGISERKQLGRSHILRLWLVPLWGKYVCVQLGRSHILRLWLVAGTDKDSTHLYIHCLSRGTSRERRDSTKCRNAYGTNWLRSIDVNSVSRIAKGIIVLRNISVNVIIACVDYSNPSVSHSSTAPLYCYATQRSKRLPFLPLRT